jgi:hypothetical protein
MTIKKCFINYVCVIQENECMVDYIMYTWNKCIYENTMYGYWLLDALWSKCAQYKLTKKDY